MHNLFKNRTGFDLINQVLTVLLFFIFILYMIFKTKITHFFCLFLLFVIILRAICLKDEETISLNNKLSIFLSPYIYMIKEKINTYKTNKQYIIITCPYCNQKLRIPKGHGNIIVTCPNCSQKFDEKS